MQKRGLLQKGFLLTLVLLLLATVVFSYTTQQSTGQVVRRGTATPFLPPTRPLPILCDTLATEGWKFALPHTNPQQLPVPLPYTVTKRELQGTLRDYSLFGSTISQTLAFNANNFILTFAENDAPIDVMSFYVHASEQLTPPEPFMTYVHAFTPQLTLQLQSQGGTLFSIPSLLNQQLQILGRPGLITRASYDSSRNELALSLTLAGRYPSTLTFWDLVMPVHQGPQRVQGLLTIDNELIEDVWPVAKGLRQGNALVLQGFSFDYFVDGKPGYTNIDLPAGDIGWQDLMDEPQAMMDLDFYLFLTNGPYRTPAPNACNGGPGATFGVQSTYCF